MPLHERKIAVSVALREFHRPTRHLAAWKRETGDPARFIDHLLQKIRRDRHRRGRARQRFLGLGRHMVRARKSRGRIDDGDRPGSSARGRNRRDRGRRASGRRWDRRRRRRRRRGRRQRPSGLR